MSLKRTPWPWLILPLALVAASCAKPCAAPLRSAPIVSTVEHRCLTQPPPDPPAALATELAGDAPLTPAALDLYEQWAAALVSYSSRAWRLCGTVGR